MKELQAIKIILHMVVWSGYTPVSGIGLSEIAKG